MEVDLTPTEKTQLFFKTIEAGDIALFDIFPEAVAIFGFTKVGKTSSCHIICDSPLCVEDIRGQLMFKPTSKKYATAKIGFTTESETQIPNTFETLLKAKDPKDGKYKFVKEGNVNKKIWVLDQPGYGDTYGFHRIFSNGYFHYRTFSKTPKLKFVLAVSRHDLTGTAQKFKKTISYFINTFNDWEKVKKDILRATSLLITKADLKTKIEDLKGTIKNLRNAVTNMGTTEKAQYQELIDEFLDKNRIYFIQRPKDIHAKTLQCNILHQIYENSSFWERKVIKNVVDMLDINFSVSAQILKELRDKKKQRFREDFETFMRLIQERKNNTIVKHKSSLVNIIKTLQLDAKAGNQQRSFLYDMETFVNQFYNFSEAYKKERQALEINLFKAPDSEKWSEMSKEDLQKQNKSVYFIKKFKVLECLHDLNQKYVYEGNSHVSFVRSVDQLEDFSSMFQVMFKRFSILKTNPKDKVIYRYSYIIQRIIEQSKVLALILFSDPIVKDQLERIEIRSFSEDIFRTIEDQLLSFCLGEIDLIECKKQFVKNLDFNSLTAIINPQIIQFFQGINSDDEQTQLKIAELIINYASSIFRNDRKPPESQKKFAVSKLYKYRNKFFYHFENLQDKEGSKKSKENFIEHIFCLTNSLAELLKTFLLWKDARECYTSVGNAMMVFQMYEQQLKTLANDTSAQRKLYIQYAKTACLYQRKELGVKCAQKAYSMSTKYSELKEASSLIVSLSTEKTSMIDDDKDETCEDVEQQLRYLKRLEGFQYCSDLSKEFKDNFEISFDTDQ